MTVIFRLCFKMFVKPDWVTYKLLFSISESPKMTTSSLQNEGVLRIKITKVSLLKGCVILHVDKDIYGKSDRSLLALRPQFSSDLLNLI